MMALFSPHHRIQTGFGAHLPPHPVVISGWFSEGKAAEAWSWSLACI